jgi:hypothetical protein
MRFSGGTVAGLVAFLLAAGAAYLIVLNTDWLGKDWRVAPIVGLLAYLAVRIVGGAFSGMRR